MALILPPKMLDERGRCCGRKPMAYKRPPHLFCPRCDASYDPATGLQKPNWCYRALGDGFAFNHEHMEREYIAANPLPAQAEG